MIATYILGVEGTDYFYVGSTGELKRRINRHFKELKEGVHHNVNLQKLHEDGFSVIVFAVVAFDTKDEAMALEEEIISANNDNPNMLNIGLNVVGGDNLTKHPDKEEIIRKRSATQNEGISKLTSGERRKRFGRSGNKNGMYGKTHTPEVKKLLSDLNKGRVPHNRGVRMSAEQKKKLLEFVKNRDYHGGKNPFYGKKHSDETKEKLRLANLGKVPVNIRKISIDGTTYDSLASASRDLNIPIPTVHYRIKSSNIKFNNYKYIC